VNNNSSYVSNYLTNNIYSSHDHNISSRCKSTVPANNREERKIMKNTQTVAKPPENIDSSKLITDIIKNINKYTEEEKKQSNITRIMNLVIIIIAIILFLITIILHSYNTPPGTNVFNK